MTYARARLWLGISTVGTFVVASSTLLYFRIPEGILGDVRGSFGSGATALAAFVGIYACVQLISDVFGAILIPRAHDRLDEPVATVVARLARAISIHSLVLWGVACTLLAAGRLADLAGVLVAALGTAVVLMAVRPQLARIIGGVKPIADRNGVYESPDRGFTGGIEGVFRPGRIMVPKAWSELLSAGDLQSALQRRQSAIENGSWLRGRLLAIAFTLLGVATSGWLAGPETLGTAAGIVRLSLWFTLWSFLGLLTLPTLSRRAVLAADREAGLDPSAVAALVSLDRIGDDEPKRSKWIETIFHPVPSLQGRQNERRDATTGYWDVARTALFLSGGGLGLLGRSVHCNAGRPALWVYLPSA